MRENLDETGFPVAGGTMRVHALRDGSRTAFWLDEKRTAMVEGPAGIPAHDRRGYRFPFLMSSTRRAAPASCGTCSLVEIEDGGPPWAGRTRRLPLQVR